MESIGNIGKQDIAASELVLNPDGSVYHLALKPEDIGDRIIVVGDPGRVKKISSRFQRVEIEKQNREFFTHTGTFNGERVTALSTGIGTDNIDIVMNELDVLANFDIAKRSIKEELRSLSIVRLGTSGALQEDIPVDSFVLSEYGMGMDGLLHTYEVKESPDETRMREAFLQQISWPKEMAEPYFVKGFPELLDRTGDEFRKGITVTAHGFYGPQGRSLRLPLRDPELNEKLRGFQHNGTKVTNFEMETSALYGLSGALGHKACTVCAIIANRYAGTFSADHEKVIEDLIDRVLQGITK